MLIKNICTVTAIFFFMTMSQTSYSLELLKETEVEFEILSEYKKDYLREKTNNSEVKIRYIESSIKKNFNFEKSDSSLQIDLQASSVDEEDSFDLFIRRLEFKNSISHKRFDYKSSLGLIDRPYGSLVSYFDRIEKLPSFYESLFEQDKSMSWGGTLEIEDKSGLYTGLGLFYETYESENDGSKSNYSPYALYLGYKNESFNSKVIYAESKTSETLITKSLGLNSSLKFKTQQLEWNINTEIWNIIKDISANEFQNSVFLIRPQIKWNTVYIEPMLSLDKDKQTNEIERFTSYTLGFDFKTILFDLIYTKVTSTNSDLTKENFFQANLSVMF